MNGIYKFYQKHSAAL